MSSTKVITGKVRFSYAHVFEPNAINEGDKEKYSVSLIIPKDDAKTLKAINEAIQAAIEEGKASKFDGKVPKNLKLPLRDGDVDREDDESYEGSMFVNANSDRKPGVVGTEKDDFGNLKGLTPDEFYSGCYGRASINFYAYNYNGTKGVACGLNNLQKTEDGVRLAGGGASAQDDFGSDDDLF